MIRIIEPQEAALNRSSKGQDGQAQEESDLEFEIVDREQIGNQLVFQWTRILLLSVFAIIFTLVIAGSPRKPKTMIDGITFLRVETSYELPQAGMLEILVPWDRQESDEQIQGLSKLCRKGGISTCWREVLIVEGALEPSLEKWVLGRADANIAIIWQQSYLLTVILAALGGARVDVIQGKPEELETLKVNIEALGLQQLVTMREQEQLNRYYWQKYSLIITEATFFTQVIYAELLERAYKIGLTTDSTGVYIHQFTSKTNFLIDVTNITRQNKEALQKLTNQMISIGNEDQKQQLIDVITTDDYYVLLDKRLKLQHHSSQQQQSLQQQPAYIQNVRNSEQDLRLKAVWYIEKMPSKQLLSFFKCAEKENPFIQLGITGQSQIHVLDREQSVNEFQSNSHAYNFIYQYLRALGGKNILLADNDPILLNMVTLASSSNAFFPSQLLIEEVRNSISKKNIQKVKEAALTKSNFQQYIVTNEISLLIASFNFITSFYVEIQQCLRLGMHIIIMNEGQEHKQSLLQDLSIKYYLYLIGKAPSLSNNCLFDFTSRLYYSKENIPEKTLLLISDFPLQIQRKSQKNEKSGSRAIQSISLPCFSVKLGSSVNHNLRPDFKTLTISRDIKMTIANDQVQDFIERAKEENSLASFLRGNLFADDKLVIVGFQSIGSYYTLLQAIRVIYRRGSLYLINFTDEQLKQIESFLLENDIVLSYEVEHLSTLNDLEPNTQHVIVVSQDLLLDETNFIARMPSNSMILARVIDDKIKDYLDSPQGTVKRYIVRPAQQPDSSPSTEGLACMNYRVDDAQTAQLSTEQTWLVILAS